MSRNLTPAMQTAAQQKVLYPVAFFEGQFVSGFVRLWTGVGPLSWNGQVWTGAGYLLGIAGIAETPGLKADGVTVTLSGIPNDLVGKCLAEVQHRFAGSVWLGLLAPSGALIADPALLFSGGCDVAQLQTGPKTSRISVTYENHAAIDRRAPIRRYTQADQQGDYPTDVGFAQVNALATADLSTFGTRSLRWPW